MKKLRLLLAGACMSMLQLPAMSQTFTVDNLTYQVSDPDKKEVTLTGHSNDPEHLVVPETVENDGTYYTVTAIGTSGLSDSSSTSISLPNTLVKIEGTAFKYCRSLTSITIPDNVTEIGDESFAFCSSVKEITYGKSVKSIGDDAWSGMDSLEKVNVYATNPPTVGRWAAVPQNAKLYVIPSSMELYKNAEIWSEFQSFGELPQPYKFYGVEYLEYPEKKGTLYITGYDYNAKVIRIEPTVNGMTVFPEIPTLMVGQVLGDLTYPNHSEIEIVYFNLENVPANFCKGVETLKKLSLKENVKSIGENAFSGTHPEYVFSYAANPPVIGDKAFQYSDDNAMGKSICFIPGESSDDYFADERWNISFNLKSLTGKSGRWSYKLLENDDTEIYAVLTGYDALEEDLNFFNDKLYIPSVVDSDSFEVVSIQLSELNVNFDTVILGEGSSLPLKVQCDLGKLMGDTFTTIVVERDFLYWGNGNSICDGTSISKAIIDLHTVPSNAFLNYEPLTEVTLLESVKAIGPYAFSGTSISEYNFEHITSIYAGAFKDCAKLTSATFPSVLRYIGDSAFQNTQLKKVSLNNVEKIGQYSFADNARLTNVTFGEALHEIGNYAFSGNSRLLMRGTLEFPVDSQLESIGAYAFTGIRFSELSLPESLLKIGEGAFSNCGLLKEINIPANVHFIGNKAFYACDYAESINFEGNVDELGAEAFYSCNNVKNINFPQIINKVGASAFEKCTGLTDIKINADYIGNRAFADCTALERITLSATEEIGDEVLATCQNLVEPIFDAPVIGQHIYAGVENAYTAIFTDKVREIKEEAFANVGLRNVVFGTCEGLELIGKKAFFNHNMSVINLPVATETKAVLTIDADAFNQDYYDDESLTMLRPNFPGLKVSVSLGNRTKIVGASAFRMCYIISLDLGSSVEEIRGGAFKHSHVPSLRIPSTLIKLEKEQFDNIATDHPFKQLIIDYSEKPLIINAIPRPLEYAEINRDINTDVYYGICSGSYADLKVGVNCPNQSITVNNIDGIWRNVIIGSGVKTIINVNNVTFSDLEFKEGVKSIIANKPSKITIGNKSLTLPSSLKEIDLNIFEGNETVTSFAINDGKGCLYPYSTDNIDFKTAFPNIENVYIGSEIEGLRFTGCEKLEKAIIGDQVDAIGTELFRDVKTLTNAILSDNVKEVRAGAFQGCTGLKVLSLSEQMQTIGLNAYKDCTGFDRIVARGAWPADGPAGFNEEVEKNVPVYIPEGSEEDYLFESDLWYRFDNILSDNGNVAENIYIDDFFDKEESYGKPGHEIFILDFIKWVIKRSTGIQAPARAASLADNVSSPESYGLYFYSTNPEAASVDQEGKITILKEEPAEIWVYALDGSDKKAILAVNEDDFILGDVNGDTNVDLLDVNQLIEAVANPDGTTTVRLHIADMNGDRVIDSMDINLLIEKCLEVNSEEKTPAEEVSGMAI